MSGYRRYQIILHHSEGYWRTLSYKSLDSARESFARIKKWGMFAFIDVERAWLVDRDAPEGVPVPFKSQSLYKGTLDYWKAQA